MQHPHHPHQQQVETFFARPLNTKGRVETPPVPKVARPVYSFFYLYEGSVLTEAGVESFLLNAHMFLLIPPHVPYAIRWYEDAVAVMGAFDESFLLNPSYELLRSTRPFVCHVEAGDRELMQVTMNKLCSCDTKTHVAQYTLDFVLNLINDHVDIIGAEGDKLAIRFVDEVFDRTKPLRSIAEYAKDFGVTPNHLNKVVRSSTRCPASEWVQISRLNYAKYLLRDPQFSVVEVAEKVGLVDPSYFSRFFRKYADMSPSEYRAMKMTADD